MIDKSIKPKQKKKPKKKPINKKITLTPQQRIFASIYVETSNEITAYKKAGYNTKNLSLFEIRIKAKAVKNRKAVNLKITELYHILQNEDVITFKSLLYELKNIINFDIGTIYDSENNVLNVVDLSLNTRKAINNIEITEIQHETNTSIKTNVKPYSKLEAIKIANKMLGFNELENKQINDNKNIIDYSLLDSDTLKDILKELS